MGSPADDGPADDGPKDDGAIGVWYVAASLATTEPDRWLLRISMTTDVDSGAREDSQVTDIEEACRLLRAWYLLVTTGR